MTQNETILQQLLSESSEKSQLRQERDALIQQHQQYHSDMKREKDAQVQKLQQDMSEVRREKDVQIEHLQSICQT